MLSLRNLKPRGLEQIDLTLDNGQCLAVAGPSGAGKTVLLRAIADLDDNTGDAATATMVRSQVAAPVWRKAVAYVPAESGWWADHVGDHMERTAAVALLDHVGLSAACLDWSVSRLSTGERQRLALVRALTHDPDVLLLDEPTSGLDDDTTEMVETLLAARKAAGTTIMIVTHDTDLAARLGDHHAHMENGRLDPSPGPSSP